MMRELSLQSSEVVLRDKGEVVARERFEDSEASLRESLQRVLRGRPPAPTRARVASSHARMFLLPWVAQLTTAERWRTLAAGRFEQRFGEPPERWQLRVADDVPPRSRLAVALPVTLTRSVQESVKPRQLVIGLLHSLGQLLAREPQFHGCAAEVEPHSACLLMFCRGELRRVRTRRFEGSEQVIAAARSEWASATADEAMAGVKPGSPVVALSGASGAIGPALASALGGSRVLELT